MFRYCISLFAIDSLYVHTVIIGWAYTVNVCCQKLNKWQEKKSTVKNIDVIHTSIIIIIYLYKVVIHVSMKVCAEDLENRVSKWYRTKPRCWECLQDHLSLFDFSSFLCLIFPSGSRVLSNLTRYNSLLYSFNASF